MKNSWTLTGLILFGQFVIILVCNEDLYNFHFAMRIGNEIIREIWRSLFWELNHFFNKDKVKLNN
jgi:hypothetical protein